MSNNLIKGFSVSYDKDKIKKLDFSFREENIFETAVKIAKKQNPNYVTDESGFTAGLHAETIPDTEDTDIGFVQMDASELEQYKEQVREEEIGQITERALVQAREELADERSRIISEAMKEAEKCKETAIEQGKEEAEAAKSSILRIASAQGYEDGLKKAREEKDEVLAKLETERVNLQNEYQRQVLEMEPAFVEILKQYVKKITGICFDNHTEVLSYLIDCGINRAPKDTDFSVKLAASDYERFFERLPEIVARYEGRVMLNFEKDVTLNPGDVKLENKDRVVNCGLGVMMEGLLDALDMICD